MDQRILEIGTIEVAGVARRGPFVTHGGDRLTRRIEVNYLSVEDEAGVLVKRTGINVRDAKLLAELAQAVRLKAIGFGATLTRTISTRQLIEAARDFMALGKDGLTYSIVNHFSAEGGDTSERAQVLIMLQGKFK